MHLIPAAQAESELDRHRAVAAAALGTMGFLYAVVALSAVSAAEKVTDLLVFVFALTVLPLACAAILVRRSRGPLPDRPALLGSGDGVDIGFATATLAALACVPFAMHISGADETFWYTAAWRIVVVAVPAHAAIGIFRLVRAATAGRPTVSAVEPPGVRRRGSMWHALFIGTFFIAWVAIFRIEPENPWFNLLPELLARRNFAPEISAGLLLAAIAGATAILAAASALAFVEHAVAARPGRLRVFRSAALAAALLLLPLAYFDFSLRSDAFHYLTIMGPALHVLHGGVPMVDAFSQYGPGPVYATLLAFMAGSPTFGAVNIMVQVVNLALYGVFLACLYRMAPFKASALVLGFLAVALVLAGWGGGAGVISVAPSTMGLRYLLPFLMVLAISCLPDGRRHSIATIAIAASSAMWNLDSVIGSVGIQAAFLVFLNLRERTYGRLFVDAGIVLSAVCGGIAATAALALAWSGDLPRFDLYLRFLQVYNMVSGIWAIPARGLFWGWAAMLMAVFLVLSAAWFRVFRGRGALLPVGDSALFYRFVPMATLTAFVATYYVGRSVAFTLMPAVLPFCAILIPAVQHFVWRLPQVGRAERMLAVIPVAAIVWALTFTFLALFRATSPYSLLVHECRDKDRCSSAALAAGFADNAHLSTAIYVGDDPWMTSWVDPPVIREALQLVSRLAPDQDRLVLLLGESRSGRTYAGDLVSLYAGAWHRWPLSMTFSDEIVPELRDRIIAAPVDLREGEIVFVRRDETALGPLERAILDRIRASTTLCPLGLGSPEVAVYRVDSAAACAS